MELASEIIPCENLNYEEYSDFNENNNSTVALTHFPRALSLPKHPSHTHSLTH